VDKNLIRIATMSSPNSAASAYKKGSWVWGLFHDWSESFHGRKLGVEWDLEACWALAFAECNRSTSSLQVCVAS
jgi:hypothetical protein